MKLYTMKCVKDPERMDECFEPDNQEEQYFVKLETQAEQNAYTSMNWNSKDLCNHWQAMLNSVATMERMTEEDIYFYITVDEPELDIGEEYIDADGLIWERVE